MGRLTASSFLQAGGTGKPRADASKQFARKRRPWQEAAVEASLLACARRDPSNVMAKRAVLAEVPRPEGSCMVKVWDRSRFPLVAQNRDCASALPQQLRDPCSPGFSSRSPFRSVKAGWSNYLWDGRLTHSPIGYLTYAVFTFINEPFASANALAYAEAFLVTGFVLVINIVARFALGHKRV
jgi:hypothetical protein